MKWLLRLLVDPADALDWTDEHGRIDHGKVMADLVILALLFAVIRVSVLANAFPPIAWGITLIAGAMGSRVFIAFLRSRTVTSTETLTDPLTRNINDPDEMAAGGDRDRGGSRGH